MYSDFERKCLNAHPSVVLDRHPHKTKEELRCAKKVPRLMENPLYRKVRFEPIPKTRKDVASSC